MPAPDPLSKELYDELRSTCRGSIYVRGDPGQVAIYLTICSES